MFIFHANAVSAIIKMLVNVLYKPRIVCIYPPRKPLLEIGNQFRDSYTKYKNPRCKYCDEGLER